MPVRKFKPTSPGIPNPASEPSVIVHPDVSDEDFQRPIAIEDDDESD